MYFEELCCIAPPPRLLGLGLCQSTPRPLLANSTHPLSGQPRGPGSTTAPATPPSAGPWRRSPAAPTGNAASPPHSTPGSALRRPGGDGPSWPPISTGVHECACARYRPHFCYASGRQELAGCSLGYKHHRVGAHVCKCSTLKAETICILLPTSEILLPTLRCCRHIYWGYLSKILKVVSFL